MRAAAITPRSNCVMNSDKLRNVGICMTEVHEAIEHDLRIGRKSAPLNRYSIVEISNHILASPEPRRACAMLMPSWKVPT